jgi:hypothetical protein
VDAVAVRQRKVEFLGAGERFREPARVVAGGIEDGLALPCVERRAAGEGAAQAENDGQQREGAGQETMHRRFDPSAPREFPVRPAR